MGGNQNSSNNDILAESDGLDFADVGVHEAMAEGHDLFPKPALLLGPPLLGHSQSNAMAVDDTPSLLALPVDQALVRMLIEKVAWVPLSASMIQKAVCHLACQVDATVGMKTVDAVVHSCSDLLVLPSNLGPLFPKLPRFLSARRGRLLAMPAQLLFWREIKYQQDSQNVRRLKIITHTGQHENSHSSTPSDRQSR